MKLTPHPIAKLVPPMSEVEARRRIDIAFPDIRRGCLIAPVVYFVQSGDSRGPIKIGFTLGRADARLRELQTGNPETLSLRATLFGNRALEARLHEYFEDARYRGEWFNETPELSALISKAHLLPWFMPPAEEWTGSVKAVARAAKQEAS